MFPLPPALRSLLLPALVLALCYVGWRTYGWPGLLLALLMSCFWVLLHFTKLLRLLRAAAGRPVGAVADVRALQGRVRPGMPMHEVIRQAACLGKRDDSSLSDTTETFVWHDIQGRTLHLRFHHGRLQRIERQDVPPGDGATGEP